MRAELLEAIIDCIKTHIPEVKHIDLWNHNVEFIEQEDAWERPAVFVEFGAVDWSITSGGKYLTGKCSVMIHTVTDWMPGNHKTAFVLCEKITSALNGLTGSNFRGMVLERTLTNHNHEDILENIDSFAVRVSRKL